MGPATFQNFFAFHISHYNLRGGGCNLVLPSYTNLY